jgi:hypothetical protein
MKNAMKCSLQVWSSVDGSIAPKSHYDEPLFCGKPIGFGVEMEDSTSTSLKSYMYDCVKVSKRTPTNLSIITPGLYETQALRRSLSARLTRLIRSESYPARWRIRSGKAHDTDSFGSEQWLA